MLKDDSDHLSSDEPTACFLYLAINNLSPKNKHVKFSIQAKQKYKIRNEKVVMEQMLKGQIIKKELNQNNVTIKVKFVCKYMRFTIKN